MLDQSFVIIGTIIGSIGGIGYLLDTIKGRAKPNRVSFLLWSIAPFIIFAAQLQQQVGLSVIMTFSTGFIPFLIFLASFTNKQAEWKLSKFDLLCGALSLVGIICWQLTQEGNLAIIFSIIADALAAIPTIRKAYYHPETEIAWPWISTVLGVILTILTLQTYTLANAGFMIYIVIVNTIIYSLVQFKLGNRFHERASSGRI